MVNKYDVFHKRLRKLVEKERERGLSMRVISEGIGISQNSLHFYAYGESFPNSIALFLLAEHYGVTMDYLMGRTAKAKFTETEGEQVERNVYN